MINKQNLQVSIICGGPSMERGISLNSARSVMDHLTRSEINLSIIYVDQNKDFYSIHKSQLYSNTPSDFDFKLSQNAKKLNIEALISKLKNTDMVFPVIHGAFGEDGELQELLEKYNIPFIGSGSQTCKRIFHKYEMAKALKEYGYETLNSETMSINGSENEKLIKNFFRKYNLKRAIIKPVAGGSSIGVFNVFNFEQAIEKMNFIFQNKIDKEVILEPFCYGKEFTIIVMQNQNNEPVALIPSQIVISYDDGKIFDYRRKYLPTSNTKWLCPPHFSDEIVNQIRSMSEDIFTKFNMKDIIRLDGWLMDDGRILFTDFNPVSGMEQNSFTFQQSSKIGLTHRDLLWSILKKSCKNIGITIEEQKKDKINAQRKKVHILCGGDTAERQVSIMSGTNVWLKLLHSDKFDVELYFLDQNNHIWYLPYSYALSHTAEEIYENCITAHATLDRLNHFINIIKTQLSQIPENYTADKNLPIKYSFEQFLKLGKEKNAFVFLGLHGGNGENGTMQQILNEHNISYNGSGPEASELCMDKYLTGEAVKKIGDSNILTVPKKIINLEEFKHFKDSDYQNFWNFLKEDIQYKTFIIKPQLDGCSAGIVRLENAMDLKKYIDLVLGKALFIEKNTFNNQNNIIEMSNKENSKYMIEGFVETDNIIIKNNNLTYERVNGWLELTVGIIEKNEIYHSLNPSITVASDKVLSVEEKFQGGTGVNLTPPPENIINIDQVKQIKSCIEKISRAFGIKNYARLDIFFNTEMNKLILIEINTLPALTPSTVIYHQALAEEKSINPKEFLEMIIDSAGNW